RRRHTRSYGDWSSDVCSSDLSQPDTPGKLVAHAYSYEHLELGGYELLRRVAERASDEETADVARRIAAEEEQMAGRLAANFDREIGRASCRERVEIEGVDVGF